MSVRKQRARLIPRKAMPPPSSPPFFSFLLRLVTEVWASANDLPPPQASGTSQTHRVQLASSGHGTVSFAIVQEKAAWWHYFGGSEHCIRSIREGQGGGLSDAKRGGGCLRRFPSPLTLLSRGNLQASLRYPHRHGRLCHGPLWLRRNSRYALTGLALWRRGPKTKKAKDRSTAATPHLQRAPEVCPGAHCECWYAGVWAV